MPLRAFLYRPRRETAAIDVVVERAVYHVELRRHRQARRYTLRIHPATRAVVLTMPQRGNIGEARAFAQQHGSWIATRLGRLPQPAAFADGVTVPLRGFDHRIVHRPDARGVAWTELADDGARLLCVAGAAAHLHRRTADFLRREAARDLTDASRRHAAALGVAFRRISIRDQVSRWGSCSSTGVLSFSWRLILAPPFVLDYLAAHEVAHLVELNHSPRFWRTLHGICPDTDRAKAWLDRHGADLHRYGLTER